MALRYAMWELLHSLKRVIHQHPSGLWEWIKKSNAKWIWESVSVSVSVQPLSPLRLTLSYMYIYNPSSLAVQLHLQRLYCPRVHLGWTQTAPLGAFMPTTMWLSWHFVCDWPPQPYSTAAIFSGLGPAAKTLGRKKRDVKKKEKQGKWLMALFDLIFCHPRMDDCRLLMAVCPIEE